MSSLGLPSATPTPASACPPPTRAKPSPSSNGHFEHVFTGESNFPPCSLEILHQSEGAAEVNGSTLLLHVSQGRTKSTNTCGDNTDTDEAGNTLTYTWELSDSAGTQQLILTNDKGTGLGPFDKKP